MSGANDPPWVRVPPSTFDIVACWYPEAGSDPGPKLRPALVVAVLVGQKSGAFAAKVAFGTKSLKVIRRAPVDLIIQNARDLRQLGLVRATRFDLDLIATLPWTSEFFGCWTGNSSPTIGSLTEDYVREYAFLMMRRGSAK